MKVITFSLPQKSKETMKGKWGELKGTRKREMRGISLLYSPPPPKKKRREKKEKYF